MATPRPCVMLWLAREGTPEEQYAAYDLLIANLQVPSKRSTIVVGDEPDLVDAEEMLTGLPLSNRYIKAAVPAANNAGFSAPTFVLAVLLREIAEAPAALEEAPLRFIGKFEFPFPERGDHISRDDQEWLGIDEGYVLGEDPADLPIASKKPWWKLW
jgi:hypothetical protein